MASSLRRSSVRGGIGMRTVFPSLDGFSPRPLPWIAFSIGPIIFVSQGVTVIRRLSGTERVPTCWSGVGVP